jgi:hypothetical protein
MNTKRPKGITRREFVELAGAAGAVLGLSEVATVGAADPFQPPTDSNGKVIPGFEKTKIDANASRGWQPFSDRKIRVGIAGHGLCQFGSIFGFQDHPNVEVVAVTDLIRAGAPGWRRPVSAKRPTLRAKR